MNGFCVFCGAEVPDGSLTCEGCASLVVGLSDEQRQVLRKLQADEDARQSFVAAYEDLTSALRDCLAPVASALGRVCQVLLELEVEL